ncbi:MAG: DUF488 family protein, partial [Terriglobia bacterium]
MTIYTIGHSTRTLKQLIGLLREHQIELLADVRAFPSSARYPHFNKEVLSQRLPEAGISYRWLGKVLGGYRKKENPNSPHSALRSPGFRNYADHMATPEFGEGIEELTNLAGKKRARIGHVAVMCAERLWWRCHRSLVSDYLSACCGVEVLHIVE